MSVRPQVCQRGAEVLGAARANRLTDALREHVFGCEQCAASLAACEPMPAEASELTVTPAGLALWRIRLRERREREERVNRPLVWGERIAGVSAVLAALVVSVVASHTSPWLAAACGGMAFAAALAAASLWAGSTPLGPGGASRHRSRGVA
jgi:hypothetical protein